VWPALQTLESAALRRSVGLRHDQTGVMVTRIAPLGEAAGVLQAGDVIRAIDGRHLSNDGSVIFRYLMRQCTQRNTRADGGRRSRRPLACQRVKCGSLCVCSAVAVLRWCSLHSGLCSGAALHLRALCAHCRPHELIAFDHLITCKRKGEPTEYVVLRDGCELELIVRLPVLGGRPWGGSPCEY
jgi:hypothetical protein